MREIKFQGKRRDTGEWVYGDLRRKEDQYDDGMWEQITLIYEQSQDYMISHEVDPETVGQYTGLKDKNGKEIYEGDIIRHKNTGVMAPVVFEYCEYIFGEFALSPIATVSDEVLEIIGNIHENPELLTKVKI